MTDGSRTLREVLAQAPRGPRIEFGVHRGATLAIIAEHEGLTVGVDSFEGMAEPGPFDYREGRCHYPRGRLKAPIEIAAARVPRARLVRGWVPEVLADLPDGPWAFAHVDLDHYEPTLATLQWLWPRMMRGGIICCDDFFPGRDWLAARAINQVARVHALSGAEGRKGWWVFNDDAPREPLSVEDPPPLPRVAALLRRLPPGPIVGAEIGVFQGRMSRQLLRRRSDLTLYMVDSWLSEEEQPGAYRATQDMHSRLSAAAQERNSRIAADITIWAASRRIILPVDSAEAAAVLRDGSLDFAFLDADHSFAGVERDIRLWLPKLKPGGLLGGHDYGHPAFEVAAAVDAAAERYGWDLELDEDLTWFVRLGGRS